MHKDASNIFNLYLEAVEEQPQMTTDERGTKKWRLHGKLHRDDGPAYENPHTGYKAWYLHNKAYAKPELWAAAVLKERNKPYDDASVDAFLRTILKKDAEAAL